MENQFGEFNEFGEENAREQASYELSPRELALRDYFVAEYIVDFDAVAAAMRCGFDRDNAIRWAKQFLSEAYVQQALQRMSQMNVDPQAEEDFQKKWIRDRLRREASYHGHGSSHGARVAALTKLSAMYGMDKQVNRDGEFASGIVEVPATQSPDEWEKSAVNSQKELMKDALE